MRRVNCILFTVYDLSLIYGHCVECVHSKDGLRHCVETMDLVTCKLGQRERPGFAYFCSRTDSVRSVQGGIRFVLGGVPICVMKGINLSDAPLDPTACWTMSRDSGVDRRLGVVSQIGRPLAVGLQCAACSDMIHQCGSDWARSSESELDLGSDEE